MRLDVRWMPALPRFKFDYQKVQQAVANLLDNALKHTPCGGSVTMHGGSRISGSGAARKRLRRRNGGGEGSQKPNACWCR